MHPADRHTVRNGILLLLFTGIALSLAGLQHRSNQRQSVTWQDVSGTLKHVETAERELFQSIQVKSVR